ncbi:V-type ATP synthase subunit E family protein [uncultured Intestinimonas sp.]|uniref:V-type ATP synthase subunit E n=1 Tax=uncultured Intestinimonas sp. TaxID=1689265 RepID=UPI0025CE01DB|nr:V-type ATP synthase subunit E family protein [uncultured Intestinimonas sp.]
MNGIEKITGQIDADLQKELDDLKAQTQTRAAEITAGYDRQAQELTQSILERGRREADLRRERLDSVAQLEARKLTLSAKQEMVARAFDLALQKLTELPEADYIALLARLAVEASRTGREQVIFSQKDRARYGKQVVTQANEILAKRVAPKLPEDLTASRAGAVLDRVVTGASAVLSGTGMLTVAEEIRPMAGGLILRDGRVESNCSFEVLIRLQRGPLSAEVARVLFP